jgi:Family of unknown function (DUF5677)
MLQRVIAAIRRRPVPIDTRLRAAFVRRALQSDREPRAVIAALAAARDEVQHRYPKQARGVTAADVEEMDRKNIEFAVYMSLEGLSVQRPAVLEHELAMRDLAKAAVRERFGDSLDDLRVLVVVAREVCEAFHAEHGVDSAKYESLVRLSARAFLIADEVLELLTAGFPSGALARWRSLHEVSVVAAVIAGHDEATATRYLEHEIVGRAKSADDYQRYGEALGEDRLDASVLEEILAQRRALVTRYGKRYNKDVGWAEHLVSDPNFRSLEVLAQRDWLRPYYSLANNPVHAGSGNLINEIGMSDARVLLTGPSASGLIDPIQLTAVSLAATVAELLSIAPDQAAMNWELQMRAVDELASRLIAGLQDANGPDTKLPPDAADAATDTPIAQRPSLLAWPAIGWEDVTADLDVERSLRRGRRVYRRSRLVG